MTSKFLRTTSLRLQETIGSLYSADKSIQGMSSRLVWAITKLPELGQCPFDSCPLSDIITIQISGPTAFRVIGSGYWCCERDREMAWLKCPLRLRNPTVGPGPNDGRLSICLSRQVVLPLWPGTGVANPGATRQSGRGTSVPRSSPYVGDGTRS